ncbi:MAG: methylenetetrahydrofolate reductase [NAD(P)H] [Calditrichaeota bacterium]|nr:MAG: methylenetetrahydrofolate reductase [NAD(P)H] [Calditrichota bacterium]
MYVIEHLNKATKPLFSYEIIPPLRGKSARDILDIVEEILPFDPPFIDVTSHSAEAYYEELNDGSIRRHIRKKRTGTISICGIIQNRYNIDTVPHLLCRGFSKEETEDAMIELGYLGIHNVLAIRGDETNYIKPVDNSKSVNAYANELVKQLNSLKKGQYLEDISNSDPIDMCIGVGGYPEKHLEAPNFKSDIQYLKAKVDAGADYIVTQMFFDTSYYTSFVKQCRDAGIEVPIIPGLKILSGTRQITSLPKNFNVTIPEELADEVAENPDHVREIGVNWAVKQCEDLLNCGTRCLHFYIMNDTKAVTSVIKKL